MDQHHVDAISQTTAWGPSRRGLLRSLAGVAVGGSLALPAIVAMATQSASPASTSEAELVQTTELERLRALVEADADVADQLHAEEYELVSAHGEFLTREEYVGGIIAGEFSYEVFEPVSESEIDVRVYGDGAVIRYQAQFKIVFGGQGACSSRRGTPTSTRSGMGSGRLSGRREPRPSRGVRRQGAAAEYGIPSCSQ
jgi:hypothetical protein